MVYNSTQFMLVPFLPSLPQPSNKELISQSWGETRNWSFRQGLFLGPG